MGTAKSKEAKFKELLTDKVIGLDLHGERVFSIDDETGRSLESSVDFHFKASGYHFLVEIDSGNAAKIIVGQYALLNTLVADSVENPVFIVVHTYKNYNPNRTEKYLDYINATLFDGEGVPFRVLHLSSIEAWLGGTVDDFATLLL